MPSSSKTLAGTLTVLIGLLSHCDHVAHAYSSGAPSTACVDMIPVHGPIAQQVPSPYVVNVSSVEVLPSGTVSVTISGDDFKGFMVTAYSSDFAVGTMVPLDDKAKVVCDALSITHTGPALKPNVTFQWTAPGDMFEGTLINFKATIVKERVIFWTGILSAEPLVYVDTSPDLPQSGGTSNSTTNNDPGSVLLPTATTTIAPGKTNQFPGHLASDPECGKSKACFHDCEAGKCTFIVNWDDEGDVIVMSMTYRVPDGNEHWVAVGFSKDQEMGDDSVTECIMHDGEVKVQQSYNDGMDNKYLDNKKAALSEQSGTLDDGLLHCTFHRKKSYPRDPLIFDLNNDYYLMVAVGEALNGIKIPHTFDVLPPVSDHPIDLQALENVAGEEPPTNVLVRIHGALMIISWVMLTSIGITTAKYGKAMFPKINPFGVNIWFQIHRVCMVTAAVLTVIAVVIMAVQCKGYCQIPLIAGEGKNHWPLHPVLGLLVLVLTVINPTMALFRPAPKAANRYLFTWSHWGVGVLAWILASLAIFIGLDLEKSHAPPEAMHAMVAWGIYHILFLVAMETLPRPLCKLYNNVSEITVQRGKVYNLERVHQDNLGCVSEDGNSELALESVDLGDMTKQMKEEEERKAKKELTREEVKVQRAMLLFHYAAIVIFTFTLLLVVYLYTPPLHSHDDHW